MSSLAFGKPIRKQDSHTNVAYFEFTNTHSNNKDEDYKVHWDPTDATFTVPDDVVTSILEIFLHDAVSYFANPPTVQQMKKHLEHIYPNSSYNPQRTYTFYIQNILIYAKTTKFIWDVFSSEQKPLDEKIPSDFFDRSQPASPTDSTTLTNGLKKIILSSDQVLEPVTDIPLQDDGDIHPFRLDNSDDSTERLYRLKVLEAKVTARLANYRAKKQADRYYSRFGRPPPDDDAITDDDDNDDDDENETEEEI